MFGVERSCTRCSLEDVNKNEYLFTEAHEFGGAECDCKNHSNGTACNERTGRLSGSDYALPAAVTEPDHSLSACLTCIALCVHSLPSHKIA